MSLPAVYTWKRAPFIRMLIPFTAGIIIQWYFQPGTAIPWIVLFISASAVAAFFLLSFFRRYRLSVFNGISINLLFISLGCLITWEKDIRHDPDWFGNHYDSKSAIIVTLTENPIEKIRSYKANASVDFITHNNACARTSGTIIIYFGKDSVISMLEYGSQLVITKSLQEIKNSHNPGTFDFKRYSLFHGITHQVYLKENEFEILPALNKGLFKDFINQSRTKVLQILRSNIKGEKELGLAEALLIGYKDDLDKTLVQSYSNTGVVHVIAISGLHLGLIYWLLTWILKPLQRKKLKLLRPVFILTGLWLFSLLAGAQPSVLRSAVMFTCIVLGDSFTRKSSIINTLALSAFLLLWINPYWLWDVGFQLSYAAVLSIVIFMQPIYHWFYIKNRILDFIWKLNAATIAAQILTVPLGVYHFHQFPTSFLFTNFIAVPLSSLILFGEILLCAVAFIPAVSGLLGEVLSWLIWVMNTYIGRIEKLPFSVWDGLQISMTQAMLLFVIAAGFGYWLMEKSKPGFKYGLIALLVFFVLRTFSFIQANDRAQMIIYNIPQKQAIDFIEGRKYVFVGDPDLMADDFIRNFHLTPSRILHRIEPVPILQSFQQEGNMTNYQNKKILAINETTRFRPLQNKVPVDLLLVSGNPKLYFGQLAKTFDIKQAVFDGSCPPWRIKYWKEDCDSLLIPWHDVSEKGAFVMNLR